MTLNSPILRFVFFILGPLSFFIIRALPLADLSFEGKSVLACTIWIAIWWITEVVEIPVTSLLPIIIFPLSGAMSIQDTTSSYGNSIIYLYLGGFILGLAVEKWNLHKRIAYKIIGIVGTSEKRLLLGVMLATAFLSMWISNTATAIMMLPIGLSIIGYYTQSDKFGKNLLLGIAYAASIGGLATLIGTPPNLILVGIVKESLNYDISFLQWMLFAFPLSCLLLIITWYYLSKGIVPQATKNNTFQMEPLQKMSVQEKRVGLIFASVALLWILRSLVLNRWLPQIDDTIIAVFGALLMFVVPSGSKRNEALMKWEDAKRIPWSILILFGAGLAIAKGFSSTDLTRWLGNNFAALDFLPVMVISLIIFASINFLTEITSNTATASMLLPILITLSFSLNMDPYPLLAGAALSASCAFMLPVATPPNAIVFSSNKITILDMMRTGFPLNIISVILIFLFTQFVWDLVF